MTQITDLPGEILRTIFRPLDTVHNKTETTIFSIMRVNRQFRDIVVDLHFSPTDPDVRFRMVSDRVNGCMYWDKKKQEEMLARMLRHERFYLDHEKWERRVAPAMQDPLARISILRRPGPWFDICSYNPPKLRSRITP